MIRVKRALSLLGVGAIALTSVPAGAAPPPAVFKDSTGNIYVHSGVTAGDHVQVDLIGQPYKKMYHAGYCGQVTLSTSTRLPSLGNSVTINGTNIDLTRISAPETMPKCTNGAFTPATTNNYKDGNKFVLVGYTPGQSVEVKFNDLPNSFKATVNGCGVAQIKSTQSRTIGSEIKINGTDYTVSSLPTADPPLCRRADGSATLYVPASWSN